MRLLHQFIGIVTLAIVGIYFVMADIVSRIWVVPWIKLHPLERERVLRAWLRGNRDAILAVLRVVGRARFDIQPRIPCRGGVLVVMNHQSLIDVPVAFACVRDGYPRMVAHARYGRGIPLVSHTMNLYGPILVEPGRTGRLELEALRQTARSAEHPIVIFPEGHRTRDGEIGPWKKAGLENFLAVREWTVYGVVVDGLWQTARLADLARHLARVRCRAESIGPFEYDGRGRPNHDAFIDDLRRRMCDKLAEMRTNAGSAPTSPTHGSEGAVSVI